MREVIRTTDFSTLSYLEAMLKAEGIPSFVFDTHASVLEGSIGILPRRLMVSDDDYVAARQLVADVDLGHELSADKA